jgi:hypothetical protein
MAGGQQQGSRQIDSLVSRQEMVIARLVASNQAHQYGRAQTDRKAEYTDGGVESTACKIAQRGRKTITKQDDSYYS